MKFMFGISDKDNSYRVRLNYFNNKPIISKTFAYGTKRKKSVAHKMAISFRDKAVGDLKKKGWKAYRKELDRPQKNNVSGIKGVYRVRVINGNRGFTGCYSWSTTYRSNSTGRVTTRKFPELKHGAKEAKEMACKAYFLKE